MVIICLQFLGRKTGMYDITFGIRTQSTFKWVGLGWWLATASLLGQDGWRHTSFDHTHSHFSAKPAIPELTTANALLTNKKVNGFKGLEIASDDHCNHPFSACTVLKPACFILASVSLLQRQPLKSVGYISSFVRRCWTKYWRVQGFPIEINQLR